ncbi:MAG: bifunctional diguanylate cyclase/phosphodiesterase [Gammaproteobacteria bacterium]|nr:bifunctional diguanylate cyclase/phosphodiesterase [Gammaproteobacteria bacterium]
MQLRHRLIISFSVMAFMIVSVFSVLSYQISIDSKKRTETNFVLHLLGEFERILKPSLQNEISDIDEIQNLSHILDFVDSNEHLILEHHGHIHHLRNKQFIPFNHSELDQLDNDAAQIAKSNKISGQSDINNVNYSWASKMVNDTDYRMILYHETQDDITFAENSKIWKRLILTAAILFWLTVWAALFLSSWITKKLDKKNQKLVYQATHDALTDLPNRVFLFQRFNELIKDKKDPYERIVLYIMDIDGFKVLNDTLGHAYGDELLRFIAERLSSKDIECDFISRLGGDEFAMLKTYQENDNIQEFIQRVQDKLSRPVSFSGIDYRVKGSIGIAIYPLHGDDPETLIQHAEVAMYKAKTRDVSYFIYSDEDNPNSVRKLKLISELHVAVKNNDLQVYYQPKINLKNKKIYGVEALVRWNHPQLGFVPPDEFISLAEQVGLISKITDQVLYQTIQDWNKWHQMGFELHVAVNISSNEFEDPNMPSRILNYLGDWNMPSSFLTLEITESIMMGNIDNTLSLFQSLRNIGIELSIDDFGTGFSSLSYLRQLPVSELKIDRSFIIEMLVHENDLKIVKTILNLAHDLNFKVVAEGIEDLPTLQKLEELGCDNVQGYYLARPMPANELEKWCAESEWGSGVDVEFSSAAEQ